MKDRYSIFILLIITILASSCNSGEKRSSTEEFKLPEWAIGPFERPERPKPVITPFAKKFYCPMKADTIQWEESDTFNPGATVKDGKIVVLYRAEDNSGQGIGKRTSRIGYAESEDGITMIRRAEPVLYPMNDAYTSIEWPGGCEDPRVAMTEDGYYVMFYTAWNRKVPRLAVATSHDLIHWEKHGLAFGKAYDGRFKDLACKSASIVTKVKNDQLVITKLNGKYFMYWGEYAVCAATSDDLIHWTPILNEQNELMEIAKPRKGFFDSRLTECGPPAIITDDGIVLIYNGKNGDKEDGDMDYPIGAYCAGQFLFDLNDPYKVLDRLDKPFFYPEEPFEMSGQYKDGTVFMEGLAYLDNRFYLYYGCADSYVGVAISNQSSPSGKNKIGGNKR